MTWTVEWTKDARNSLIEIWIDSDDRNAISHCADDADVVLATSPKTSARLLIEDLWRMDIPPLRFHLEINSEERVVTVVGVTLRSNH